VLFEKKLSKSGGVTLPSKARQILGYTNGMGLDVVANEETGEITIKKHVPTCRFCGSVDSVLKIGDIELCQTCSIFIKSNFDEKFGTVSGVKENG
jgi:transcriptional pleiotropic regulator of transition state genes